MRHADREINQNKMSRNFRKQLLSWCNCRQILDGFHGKFWSVGTGSRNLPLKLANADRWWIAIANAN